jgi:glycosyltransferase involved in cell wall biosynthesis
LKSEPLRVVALSWRDLANPSAGGAEVLIDRLLLGLGSRGHDVTLVCGGPVTQHPYDVINAGGEFSQYLAAPLICSARARLRRADVLIDVENGLPYFSPLWRRKPSLCLVHHVHTDQWGDRFPGPVAAACRVIENRVMPAVYRNRMFVAVSESTADDLWDIGVPRSHIRTIESGVDLPVAGTAERSEEPLFISLNRLVPHKRVDLLLKAWALAAGRIPGRLMVLGDGPELAHLRHSAANLPRVEVTGRVSEEVKNRLLAEAWGIVSTAHHEGWGMSIMEAAAAETPALAIDAPGIRDAIVDGVTGVLVRAPQSELPAAFADALVSFASDVDGRKRLGVAARERAVQFSWERTIDRWEDILEEVAS